MPHTLTKIVDGPREDGRVRFFCDNCNSVTNWILPAEPGFSVQHYCKMGDEHTRNASLAGRDPQTTYQEICTDGLISQAAISLSAALRKAQSVELKEQINVVLGSEFWRNMHRLALREAIVRKDAEDGLNSGTVPTSSEPTNGPPATGGYFSSAIARGF